MLFADIFVRHLVQVKLQAPDDNLSNTHVSQINAIAITFRPESVLRGCLFSLPSDMRLEKPT